MQDVSRLNKENNILRQSLDQVVYQNSVAHKELNEKSEQAMHFQVKYLSEKEDNKRLRAEVKQLQKDYFVAMEHKLDRQSADNEDQSKATITRLQGRIKQLNEDVAKLKKHSKDQSHQILRLRQQAEVTKVFHICILCSEVNIGVD